MATIEQVRTRLGEGLAIPACPLALNVQRRFDERRQRALFRYYLAAGAGGLAVGVHTTQFAIRDPKVGLSRPVLELAAEELRSSRREEAHSDFKAEKEQRGKGAEERLASAAEVPSAPFPLFPSTQDQSSLTRIGVAGICGATRQAVAEATLACELGYHAGLLSLGAMRTATEDELLAHCRAVAEIIPLFGFYLQPAVGGRVLPFSFWRRFAEIQNVVAIKIAPFNRYQTLDVVRALAEAGREDIALYTGNDDNIVLDLLTPFRFRVGDKAPVALSPLQTTLLSDPTPGENSPNESSRFGPPNQTTADSPSPPDAGGRRGPGRGGPEFSKAPLSPALSPLVPRGARETTRVRTAQVHGEGGGGGRGRDRIVERRIVGGLLGHWAVWTKRAVELHAECRGFATSSQPISAELLRRAGEVTDCNAAFFDAANHYAGCIPGLHEILRRQGLLEGIWCLDPAETLSPGQREEIDRVCRAYPHLRDDEFVAAHRDEWLAG